jgi:hypothetical protein
MIKENAKRLAEYKAKIVELEKQVAKERTRVLAHLHEEYGFASAKELIRAIRKAAGRGVRRGAPRRRKYTRITADLKVKIKKALQRGKTGAQVAGEYGVSLPSVYNLKKAFGLVKARTQPKAK